METLSEIVGIAKRKHKARCWVCRREIKKGHWFRKQTNVDAGDIWTTTSCKRCDRWFMNLLNFDRCDEVWPDCIRDFRCEVLRDRWAERRSKTLNPKEG